MIDARLHETDACVYKWLATDDSLEIKPSVEL